MYLLFYALGSTKSNNYSLIVNFNSTNTTCLATLFFLSSENTELSDLEKQIIDFSLTLDSAL